MIRKYIDKIGDNKNVEDMKKLGDILSEVLYELKEYNYDDYKEYKIKLMGMANGYKFDEETGKEIVENMKPLGEYWDIETTNSVKTNSSIDNVSFYIVMNSLANDYGEIIDKEDVETYVRMTDAFINDKDGVKNKVWIYFNMIPRED